MSRPPQGLGTKDLGARILVPRSWYQDLGTKLLVPGSWYQDLGTKDLGTKDLGARILVQRSWYQDLGTKILVPRSTESPRGGASRNAGGHGGLQAPRQGVWGAGSPPGTAGGLGGGSPPVKTILWTQDQDFGTRIWYFLFKKYEIWSEMGPYGSVGAHIKTGKRYIWLRSILKSLLTQKKGHGMTKSPQKKQKIFLSWPRMERTSEVISKSK